MNLKRWVGIVYGDASVVLVVGGVEEVCAVEEKVEYGGQMKKSSSYS